MSKTQVSTPRIIAFIIWFFVTAPIWYYLFYKILVAVNASELMFFLYWIYMPSAIIGGIIVKLSDEGE